MPTHPQMGQVASHAVLIAHPHALLFGVERSLQLEGPPDILQGPSPGDFSRRRPQSRFLDFLEVVPESHEGLVVHGLIDAEHGEGRGLYWSGDDLCRS